MFEVLPEAGVTPSLEIKPDDMSKSDLLDVLARCLDDTALWCSTFFPEIFYAPFSSMHYQLFDLIDHKKSNRKVCAAPRGFGKTSIKVYGTAAKRLLLGQSQFVVYISNSATLAEGHTENLKRELISNKLIRTLFGDIRVSTDKDVEEQFSRRAWVLHLADGRKSLVFPRGLGQQVRGLLFNGLRPDLIIYDDLENKDSLRNPEIRQQMAKWFWSEPLKCGSRFEEDRIKHFYIDTLKHEDSLLKKLLNHSGWAGLRMQACKADLTPTDPLFMSAETLKQEYELHKEAGMLDVFHQEYRNESVAPEDATFLDENFRYYQEARVEVTLLKRPADPDAPALVEQRLEMNDIRSVVIVDPAKTIKIQSDPSSINCYGLSSSQRLVLVREITNERLKPEEIYAKAIEMAIRYGCHHIGVEVDTLNDFITTPFKEAIRASGSFLNLIELGSGNVKKEKRIGALSPYYANSMIYHRIGVCSVLESQLKDFPFAARDDVADNLAYLPQMMKKIEFSFIDQKISRAEQTNDPEGFDALLAQDRIDASPIDPSEGFFGNCF